MKKLWLFLGVLALSIPMAQAAPNSLKGGQLLRSSSTAHQAGLGWPSVYYEWWHGGGEMNWALGGELVYGDWLGEFSDVEIGFAVNFPMKWDLHRTSRADVAFRLAPGGMFADGAEGPGDVFVFGGRMEFGVPVTVRLDPKVNLLTGGNIPAGVIYVEDFDTFVVVPIYGRLGVEVAAADGITPWLLIELGPAIAFGDFGSEVEFGFRVSLGSSFF